MTDTIALNTDDLRSVCQMLSEILEKLDPGAPIEEVATRNGTTGQAFSVRDGWLTGPDGERIPSFTRVVWNGFPGCFVAMDDHGAAMFRWDNEEGIEIYPPYNIPDNLEYEA